MTKKRNTIQSVTINPERGRALKDKSIDLFDKQREIIKESQIVAFLIDNALELVDIDEHGLYLKQNED